MRFKGNKDGGLKRGTSERNERKKKAGQNGRNEWLGRKTEVIDGENRETDRGKSKRKMDKRITMRNEKWEQHFPLVDVFHIATSLKKLIT